MDSGTAARQIGFALLGPVRAWRAGGELDLGPVKQQAVLASLVLRPGVTVSHQELLDGVWGSAAAGMGRSVVPGYVHRLRACIQSSVSGADASGDGASADGVMDSVIRSERSGYRFVRESADVDVAQLEEITAAARGAKESLDLTVAVDEYRAALDLYRGEPLGGLPGPFAEAERARLVRHRFALTQETLECQIWQGLYTAVVGELSALCAMQPHDESFAALLMRALYGCGRQAEALEVFMSMRERLVDELAVEPGEELSRIQQAVLRRDDAVLIQPPASLHPIDGGGSAGGEPVRPVGRRVHNDLPADVADLVGRAAQIARLTVFNEETVFNETVFDELVSDAVWLGAVDGVAGVGKTAMAVHAAWSMRERFPDGCLFLDLHGHSYGSEPLTPQRALRRLLRSVGADAASAVNAVNCVDGVEDLDELAAAWRSATSGLRLLLVLDDASGAGQVRPLLPTGAGSRVLVTSRRRLTGLDADCRISLQPLDLDDAVGLLRRIVGGARTDREPEATRELARLCDGLPLALRIAGARLQDRSPWTMAHFVSRLIDDERRIGELATEDRSVEAAFQLSYDQLSDTQRRAFRALGLSPAVELDRLTLAAMLDWAPQDAESVLESLVDASLVQQPAVGRYRMHELVAAHARRMSAAEHEPAPEPAGEAAMARNAALRLCLCLCLCKTEHRACQAPGAGHSRVRRTAASALASTRP
jgi:DNA-binding SARP family transcriptional activator